MSNLSQNKTTRRTSHNKDTSKDPFMLRADVEELLDEKLSKIATSAEIQALRETIENQQRKLIAGQSQQIEQNSKKLEAQESTIAVLHNVIDQLKKSTEANEQYSRRLCLRIVGLPQTPNETADDCLNKCRELFKLNLDIPDTTIDRAHRLRENKKKENPVIIKFTTWRHRSLVYRARKNLDHIKIRLDLTKDRLNLLTRVQDIASHSNKVDYVFADINCALVTKMKDKSFFHFEDTRKLIEKIREERISERNDNSEEDDEL